MKTVLKGKFRLTLGVMPAIRGKRPICPCCLRKVEPSCFVVVTQPIGETKKTFHRDCFREIAEWFLKEDEVR